MRRFARKIFDKVVSAKSQFLSDSVQKQDSLTIYKIHFSINPYIKWILQFVDVIYRFICAQIK